MQTSTIMNVKQLINKTKGFERLHGVSVVIGDNKGQYWEADCYRRGVDLYFKKGSYIRLKTDGKCGSPLRWHEFQIKDCEFTYGRNDLGWLVVGSYKNLKKAITAK